MASAQCLGTQEIALCCKKISNKVTGLLQFEQFYFNWFLMCNLIKIIIGEFLDLHYKNCLYYKYCVWNLGDCTL